MTAEADLEVMKNGKRKTGVKEANDGDRNERDANLIQTEHFWLFGGKGLLKDDQ